LIVVDVETTGLDPGKDQIISIGAVDFASPHRTYYKECRLSRGVKASRDALEITGFSLVSLKDTNKPTLREILRDFEKWTAKCNERTLAGENPWFDATFLRRAFREHGLSWPFGHRYVDLHSLSYATMMRIKKRATASGGKSGLSLDETLRCVGLEPRKGFHNALGDAKLEAEAFSRLIYGKALFKEYTKYHLPDYLRRV
jgi:DNA polymerase III epsilon subunit-like protein